MHKEDDMDERDDNEPTAASLADIPTVGPKTHRLRGRGLYAERKLTLRALRTALDLTQVDVAARAGLTQGQVSSVETRGDHKVSTLARYATALGGELDVSVIINGRRYHLADV